MQTINIFWYHFYAFNLCTLIGSCLFSVAKTALPASLSHTVSSMALFLCYLSCILQILGVFSNWLGCCLTCSPTMLSLFFMVPPPLPSKWLHIFWRLHLP